MAAASKTVPGKGDGARGGSAASGRPFATVNTELNKPYVPGESPAELKEAAETWPWLILAAVGVVALLGYVRGWPLLQQFLYRPSPARDYVLPPSAHPLYVIAGVGVGWFWLLFIAVPLAAAALAALWWALQAMANHRARTGHVGHLRPGQVWPGEQYPAVPMILAAAALLLATSGALLRWSGHIAALLVGRLLLVAVLAVMGFGFVQFARWAYARAGITSQINKITFLATPALGWPDPRAGRVKPVKCAYPRGEKAFPSVVRLLYSKHPREVSDEMIAEISAVMTDITGHTYQFEHDMMTRSLTATEAVIVEQDPVEDAESVLGPMVALWFDAAARIVSVVVSPPVVDEDGDGLEDVDIDEELAQRSAVTGNDAIAAQIREFTISFAYTIKVSSAYRRGVIEGMVCDSLGGSWEAEWSMASRRVRFVRSPGLPTMVDPPLEFPVVTRSTIRSLYKKTCIPFGIDAYGNVMEWDFRQSPHFLIAGATSTGKTSLLMTVATQCTRRGINVVWVDPKGFDSPGMRNWPNCSLVTAGTDEDGLVGHTAALRFLADTMRDRLSQVKINPNKADDFDPIVLITDEFSNLVVALAEFYKTYRTTKERGEPPTSTDVGILLRTARAVAIHMAIGIQRPDTMYVAGEARDNTGLRVAMGRLRSKDAAIMMFNDAVAGTRLQPGIKGRGTVQLPDGTFREMQAFYTPRVPATAEQEAALTDHEKEILDELRNVDSFWPRRVVDSALRGYDPEDDDEDNKMSFKKIRDSRIVLASDRPDLDPMSDRYVRPLPPERRPTMDDDHAEPDPDEEAATWRPLGLSGGPKAADGAAVPSTFAGPVDGFDDDYEPTTDEEYGPVIPVTANELRRGDLVDVSVDGVQDWRYVHAEPYLSDDADGSDRLVIPFRDLEDGGNVADIDVDPYEVMQARQLHMN
ncbi:FtsK/SpoIIIE domain-containing protein [Mycobacterium sp. SMC-13]|uniref:FtsK/SpoIIIE domain-containing protein n=1 Tax=Mycobacterium sp. SMC-13 TaxID=3381626 RepID=UPI0038762DAB